ncbi:MAG: transposase [Candidatus Omnitrophica bacterium]|nr:transposase [Candidatus Omnitrophota bacterium]
MPRLPRIHIEQGLYLVTTRGGQTDLLFKDDRDREEYLDLLTKYKAQYGFKLFAYALMSSFIHLLIELMPRTTVSEIMHVMNSTYTKYYNNRYGRGGHLFKGRFKASVVEKEVYLADLTRFIHLAPSRVNSLFAPEKYRWSSYSLYLEAKGEGQEVLAKFSPIVGEQIRLYKDFITAAKEKDLKALERKAQSGRIIGTPKFVERIQKEVEETTQKEKAEEDKVVRRTQFHKVFVIVGSLLIVALSVVTYYYYSASKKVEDKVENMFQEKGEELKKDLEEKYRADLVSYYRATTKRVEREMKKREELGQ